MTDIRWVIIGKHGLYTGQWLTRRGAIYGHVKEKYASPSIYTHEDIMKKWRIN